MPLGNTTATVYAGNTAYTYRNGKLTRVGGNHNNNNQAAATGSSSDGSDPNDRHASGDNVPNEARAGSCGATTPVGTPDLFQINRRGDKATIYFTPVRDYTDRYHVVFGNSEGDERYGGIAMQVSGEQNNGVLAIEISNLDPTAQYSFKVAPVNDCAVGTWSNWLTAKRTSAYSWTRTYRYN